MKLEAQLCADCERVLGANEDAAVADINGIALDELIQRRALELDLERDGGALLFASVGIAHA